MYKFHDSYWKKCEILTFKVGYTFCRDTLSFLDVGGFFFCVIHCRRFRLLLFNIYAKFEGCISSFGKEIALNRCDSNWSARLVYVCFVSSTKIYFWPYKSMPRTLVLQKNLLEGPLCLFLWVICVIGIQTQFSRYIEFPLHLQKDIETASYYLFHYHNFSNERRTLLYSVKEIGYKLN